MNEKQAQLFQVLTTLFCVVVVLSNVLTGKLIRAPFYSDLALPAGLITYPITFLISDVVTEIFGAKRAKFMVLLGFLMCFVSYAAVSLILFLPAYDPSNQRTFETAFSLYGPALYSSMIAFVISQIVDIRLYEAIKKFTGGKHLWLRNCGSTLISQAYDTFFVTFIFFYFGVNLDLSPILKITLLSYVYKAAITLAFIPLFYIMVNTIRNSFIKRAAWT